MRYRYFLVFVLFNSLLSLGFSQGKIDGMISNEDNSPAEFVSIGIPKLGITSMTNSLGKFTLSNIPFGTHTLVVNHIGYKDTAFLVTLSDQNRVIYRSLVLTPTITRLEDFVVTGTRTSKRKTESAIIVNVLTSQTLENVQACNLSEGLKFQPGLRVETDCQTCNYTQLRMNGLAGGYSQILINGRPIFSPITSLYGLEQIPVNMIERVEIIRGGGSSLYGSSAIGGTVNVITKLPTKNNYEVNLNSQLVNNQSLDNILSGNASLLNKDKNAGMTLFINQRNRELYDHNSDEYSELPELNNTSFGVNSFFLIGKNQKIEVSLSRLYEYRYGGEMTDSPTFLAQQAEERTHNVWMGSADYQINFNKKKSSFISYVGWQQTKRDHYTGILPDEDSSILIHKSNPPYGNSFTRTIQGGFQLNHKLTQTLGAENVLTFGTEYLIDNVFDEIPAYTYLVDQSTQNLGSFIQSDWKITPQLNLLTGVRMDKHNLVKNLVFSPRASLLYSLKKKTQFRLSYGAGFRAPQAFDTDLHIAFAGGGISRVQLSPELSPERSHSFSTSVNYDKVSTKYIAGFTLEGFYTRLNNAFILNPIGEDEFGEVFEKNNGQCATVQGATLELRANLNMKLQIETGVTLQTSRYANEVSYIEGLEGINDFIRTPKTYGYGVVTVMPASRLNGVLNYLYTGTMKVPHFAGAPNQLTDEIIDSKAFHEVSLKLNYRLPLKKVKTNLTFYSGVRNIFNSYQAQFDIGKNRDSNFVFGPAQPRTIYLGLKLGSL